MSRAELDRLSQDLAADRGLAERLRAALDPGADPAEAARLLRAAGYDILGDERLRLLSRPLPLEDADLRRVAGGVMTLRNPTNPFGED